RIPLPPRRLGPRLRHRGGRRLRRDRARGRAARSGRGTHSQRQHRLPARGGAPRFRSGGRDAACRRRARAVGRAGAIRRGADGSLASDGHTARGLLAMDIRRVPRAPLIALALFALMALPSFVEFYVDWLWFGELGYRQVFWKSITTRAVLGAVTFVLASAFLGANLFLA